MFNKKKHEIARLTRKLEYALNSEDYASKRVTKELEYTDKLRDNHAIEIKELKATHESKLQHLQHALSQQANEFRYILLDVARIGDVNLEVYLKSNQYEKLPRVNFKQLREDLQAHDREIERVARLDSLGPTAIKE